MSVAAEIRERLRQFEARTLISPSARTSSAFLPYRPESSNPEKILDVRDWDLFVIDMPKINAFVLPTKEIFVYAGLIDLLEKEEPLIAAVMAHEISKRSSSATPKAMLMPVDNIVHVTERHAVENMGFLALSSVIFDILRGVSFALTISFPLVTDALGSVFNAMNDIVAERAYSRKLESEADTLGLMVCLIVSPYVTYE
jgi:predicted Zn-dependent protease